MIFKMVRASQDLNEYNLQYKFDDYQEKDSRCYVCRMGELILRSSHYLYSDLTKAMLVPSNQSYSSNLLSHA
jgi:hypothetical protein